MTEETETPIKPSAGTETETETEVPTPSALTQDQVNEIISRRLNEVSAKHKAETDALRKRYEDEMAKSQMSAEERAKAEVEEKIAELERTNAELKRTSGLKDISLTLQGAGLPAGLAPYCYDDDETVVASRVSELSKAFAASVKAGVLAELHKGAPQAPSGDAAGAPADMRAVMRRAAGLKE
ncbi:MAG: DUF4355 domain-containing protein [Gudongella sp.]|nr:DUF4355 domain-containing protein [Gudongella sp.]